VDMLGETSVIYFGLYTAQELELSFSVSVYT